MFDVIDAENSAAALKWFLGLEQLIFSLEVHPYRHPTASESDELRHALYGRKPHIYRVIYRVLEKLEQVEVLHIRHGARKGFTKPDIE